MPLSAQEHEELTEILQVLQAERGSLNERSQQFVDDQIERFERYGESTTLSPKQWNWLRELYEKATK